MSHLRALSKLALFIPHIIWGIVSVYLIFPRLSQIQKNNQIEAWANALLAKLAIKLVVRGAPTTDGPVLFVSNHISWLDILVMHASQHCRFVSKADVKHWPVLGALATAGGTLYIERESRRDALRVVRNMSEALKQGDILGIFPEGTTGNGIDLLPFHANLLQAAIDANAPVQALALCFLDPDTLQITQDASYIGKESLFESLWRTLQSKGITAVVHYGEPQLSNGRDRRAWCADLYAEIVTLRQASMKDCPT